MAERNDDRAAEEILALEGTLKSLKAELATRYYQAGKRLIDMAEDEQRRIDAIAADIISMERRLADVRRDAVCEYCDCINSADSAYCKRCGKKLQTKEMTS